MPIERTSRDFKDLSMSFLTNPLNYDLIALKNETAISRSVRNLVFTVNGERLFNQNIGSRVSRFLFENLDDTTAIALRDEIEYTIVNFEPRVDLIEVNVVPNYDMNEFNVTIIYSIVGINVPAQQLSFALEPTR
jgi:phage baseplate assembly protein W